MNFCIDNNKGFTMWNEITSVKV